MYMKTGIKTLAVLLLVGLFGSSCATVRGLNAEYEEETTRIEQMSAEEKAELEKEKRLESKIDWRGYDSDSDDD
jgi:hypothetical protein